jgi:hypothetical protein
MKIPRNSGKMANINIRREVYKNPELPIECHQCGKITKKPKYSFVDNKPSIFNWCSAECENKHTGDTNAGPKENENNPQ